MCTFSYGHLFLVSIFYQLTSEKSLWLFSEVLKTTLAIYHIVGKLYLWLNFILSKTWKAFDEIKKHNSSLPS